MPARSFHFIPAHKPHLFDRLDRLGADQYIFDLEDAVPLAEKPAARGFLDVFFRGRPAQSLFVRIHEPGHPEHAQDTDLLRRLPEVGVVLPKFSGSEDIQAISLSVGLSGRPFILMIESFAAVRRFEAAIERARWRPYGIGLGFEDLLTDVTHDAEDLVHLLRHLRTTLAVACRSCGIFAIDGISGADEDNTVLERQCQEGRACGLHGKFSIHPQQIPTINRFFGPDPALVRWAEQIASLTGLRDDLGYERIGDQIVTPPKIKKARQILEAARSLHP